MVINALSCMRACTLVKSVLATRAEQTPDDMGDTVVFFASEDAKNITGQVIHVDGGMTMR